MDLISIYGVDERKLVASIYDAEKNSSSIYGLRAESWFSVYVMVLVSLDSLILGPESSSDRTRYQ